VLLTPRSFKLLEYAESSHTPPDTNPNRRVDSYRKVVESPSIIQLARDRRVGRLMRPTDCDRTDDIRTRRGRAEARAGGGDLVILLLA